MPKVSVIIPARDAHRTLPKALEAAAAQELEGGFELIVVDNGSLDHTMQIASQTDAVDRVVCRERGEGPGAARNAGATVAQGELLAFMDADCWPAPGWLAAGAAAFADADLVQGRVLPDPDTPLGPFDRTLWVNSPYGLFETANLFVSRELFERVGGFPAGLESERLLPGVTAEPFGEDVIFGWEARRAGARTSFCPEALVYHEVQARGPVGFVRERARRALFPSLARRVPELRQEFFYGRIFFSQRSASYDLALLGAAWSLAARRRAPLAAAVPYVWLAAHDARRWGRGKAPAVALAELAGDTVGAVALMAGSVLAGSVLV